MSVLSSCICILNHSLIAVFGEVMAFLIFGALLIQIKYILGCRLWEYMRLTTRPIYSLCFSRVVEMRSQCCGLWIWTLGAQYVVRFGRIMEPSRYGAQLQEVCCGCELWECVGVPCFCVVEMCDLSASCSWCPVPPSPPCHHLYQHMTLRNLKCMNSSLILSWNFIKATEKEINRVMSLSVPSETEFTHIQQVQKQSPYEYLWRVIRQQRMEEA